MRQPEKTEFCNCTAMVCCIQVHLRLKYLLACWTCLHNTLTTVWAAVTVMMPKISEEITVTNLSTIKIWSTKSTYQCTDFQSPQLSVVPLCYPRDMAETLWDLHQSAWQQLSGRTLPLVSGSEMASCSEIRSDKRRVNKLLSLRFGCEENVFQ